MIGVLFTDFLLPGGGSQQSFVVLLKPLSSSPALGCIMRHVRPVSLLIRKALLLAPLLYPGLIPSPGSYYYVQLLVCLYSVHLPESPVLRSVVLLMPFWPILLWPSPSLVLSSGSLTGPSLVLRL